MGEDSMDTAAEEPDSTLDRFALELLPIVGATRWVLISAYRPMSGTETLVDTWYEDPNDLFYYLDLMGQSHRALGSPSLPAPPRPTHDQITGMVDEIVGPVAVDAAAVLDSWVLAYYATTGRQSGLFARRPQQQTEARVLASPGLYYDRVQALSMLEVASVGLRNEVYAINTAGSGRDGWGEG